MSRVSVRLRKLEERITDRTGLVPRSEAWFRYWGEKLDRFLESGEEDALRGISLAVIDGLMEQDDARIGTVPLEVAAGKSFEAGSVR